MKLRPGKIFALLLVVGILHYLPATIVYAENEIDDPPQTLAEIEEEPAEEPEPAVEETAADPEEALEEATVPAVEEEPSDPEELSEPAEPEPALEPPETGMQGTDDGFAALEADGVCQILDVDGVSIVGNYNDFADALAAVGNGQTISLLEDVNHNSNVVISSKSVTFDVNGFILNIEVASGDALVVDGGAVLLDNAAGGKFNVRGGATNGRGVYVQNGGKATVTNASTLGGSTDSRSAQVLGAGSAVTVLGNANGGFYSVEAKDGASISVIGYISGGGAMIADGVGTTVTIGGYSSGGGTGVYAVNGATVNISGNVYGNIGVFANSGAQVTIGGVVKGDSMYVYIDGTVKAKSEHEPVSSKTGYFQYTKGSTNVWIRDPDALRVTIITHPESTFVTEGAITESLVCVAEVSNGSAPVYQWYANTTNSNEGGTPIDGATSSVFMLPTTLTMTDGPYYYYCVASADGAPDATSNAATLTVVLVIEPSTGDSNDGGSGDGGQTAGTKTKSQIQPGRGSDYTPGSPDPQGGPYKTGDSGTPGIFLLLLCCSAICIAFVLRFARQNNEIKHSMKRI